MIRTLLSLMIGTFLLLSAPTSSEACSYNCKKIEIKDLKFNLGKPSNSFGAGAGGNKLILPITDSKKIGAVVLLPGCSGIKSYSRGDLQRWGDLLLENGYAVLAIDHLTSRGVEKNCGGRRKLQAHVLTKDVYDAVSLLSQQPTIDKSRIFTLGFSLGAMTGGALAGRYSWLGNGVPKPRAVAGLYGGCYGYSSWLKPDADIPVLWLVGGKDTESPPNSCQLEVEQIKDRGLMTFHEYPNATHCWDCSGLNGFTKTAGNGNFVRYIYDSAVTKDSEQRVLNFFNSFQSQ